MIAKGNLSKKTRRTTSKRLPARARPTALRKTSARRLGATDSDTRNLLLDAAERLMCEEGYAAVTSRRLGAKAGVKSALIHYYFRNMDDLFLALWRRFTDVNLARGAQAFVSRQPLRTMWEHITGSNDESLGAELMALGRHRKAIGAEIARTAEQIRKMQASALSEIFDRYGLRPSFGSPEILTVLIAGLARILVVEDQLGISFGHAQTRALVESWLARFEQRDGITQEGRFEP
jgi:AcrR family transcriptional regulator